MKKDDDLAIPAFLRLTAEERFRERAKEAAETLKTKYPSSPFNK